MRNRGRIESEFNSHIIVFGHEEVITEMMKCDDINMK